ncbi:Myb-like DNA-binding domain-containing protein [Spironucleus salmonicida]|uniref:Myb-like DNA-binding domain-containing protein n=1 Tax=Spironucleus salmonicida TaxID=348837 RepID=V6LPY2_9EUKA|nr:Myb-like DNA-binding domain-containing protein [Spironucleus salmonicida]|eukprot:EST46722.1 Myb-like DNA-binding domain-containing protein [Spironucleus salmonicida]
MKLYWTFEREEQLALAVQQHGKKWSFIMKEAFPDSSVSILKNKWTKMQQEGSLTMYNLSNAREMPELNDDDVLVNEIIQVIRNQ